MISAAIRVTDGPDPTPAATARQPGPPKAYNRTNLRHQGPDVAGTDPGEGKPCANPARDRPGANPAHDPAHAQARPDKPNQGRHSHRAEPGQVPLIVDCSSINDDHPRPERKPGMANPAQPKRDSRQPSGNLAWRTRPNPSGPPADPNGNRTRPTRPKSELSENRPAPLTDWPGDTPGPTKPCCHDRGRNNPFPEGQHFSVIIALP